MYNTISILQYVFWKVSTIFFPKYESRNCQKTRSIHSCRKLVNPPPSKFTSLCRLQTPGHGQSPRSISALPQAPVAFQEPRISLCTSVLTTKFCPMVLAPQASRAGLSSPPTLRTVFSAVVTQLGFRAPPAPLCLRVVVHPKDAGWRDTKVSKGNGQSILMSCIFAL